LVSPSPHQEFVVSADAPPERQQVLFQAAGAEVWWFVDGQPVSAPAEGGRAWWSPTPGTHAVRAVDASGRTVEARIFVRGK